MNSNNTKTLIITQAVAEYLLNNAGKYQNTAVEIDTQLAIDDVDGFKVHYEHPQYGPQLLIGERIEAQLFSVSFAGREEYLEKIHTDGWNSSATSLVEYLHDLNPELTTDISELHFYELGENYVVYTRGNHDVLDIDNPIFVALGLGTVEGAQLEAAIVEEYVVPALDEVLTAVEDAFTSDEITAAETIGGDSPDAPQDTPAVATFRDKVRRFALSPAGLAVGVAVLATVSIVGAKFAIAHLSNGAADDVIV